MEGINLSEGEKLKEELELRGKYYFKGFGNLLQGLLANLCNYLEEEPTLKKEKVIRDQLGKIDGFFRSIPFNKITNHPDYELLSETKDAVCKLIEEVSRILTCKETKIEKSEELIGLILEKGEEYKKTLITLEEKLNLEPDYEKYRLNAINVNTGEIQISALKR